MPAAPLGGPVRHRVSGAAQFGEPGLLEADELLVADAGLRCRQSGGDVRRGTTSPDRPVAEVVARSSAPRRRSSGIPVRLPLNAQHPPRGARRTAWWRPRRRNRPAADRRAPATGTCSRPAWCRNASAGCAANRSASRRASAAARPARPAGGQPEFHRGRRRDAIAGEEVFARAQDRCRAAARTRRRRRRRPGPTATWGSARYAGSEMSTTSHSTRHAAAEPYRRAVDRGDDRQREAQHLLDDLSTFADTLVASDRIVEKRSDPVQVTTGAERPARAGQDDDPGLRVGHQLPPDIGQRPVQGSLTQLSSAARLIRTVRIGPSASTVSSSGRSYFIGSFLGSSLAVRSSEDLVPFVVVRAAGCQSGISVIRCSP